MRAAFRTMWLSLRRDRGALAMSFALPVVFFLIFAAIFAGASGEGLRLEVAIADEAGSDASRRLFRAVAADSALTVSGAALSAADVRQRVRSGAADVGLVAPAGRRPLGDVGGFGPAPLVIVVDPARRVAGSMLAGIVQRAYFRALPDVALGGVAELIDAEFTRLTPEQKQEIDDGLADLRGDAEAGRGGGLEELVETEAAAGRGAGLNHVAYYAGAVAILFLFFSCVHGALSLLEERDSEVLDRVLAGPAGTAPLLAGKFLFLALQGTLQVLVIYVVAWIVHGVDLPGHLAGCLAVTVAAAAAAAGLSLALTAACATRRQAQTLANVAILIASALGGSMVPRFFMPEAIQRVGWLTPTTWALEAYTALFWRDDPASALVLPVALLLATAALALLLARRLTRRWETL
jgi:ABC-2 type transport system permease protein